MNFLMGNVSGERYKTLRRVKTEYVCVSVSTGIVNIEFLVVNRTKLSRGKRRKKNHIYIWH